MTTAAKTVCRECGQTGGRFRFVREGEYVHTPSCDRPQQVRDGAKGLWGFTSTHIAESGEPVKVNSLRHLRTLEREHGVISRVGNYDASNY